MMHSRFAPRPPRLPAAVTALAWLALTAPSMALGSCAQPPELAQHVAAGDVVFVGSVQALADNDRAATFAVEEQWQGIDLPATVQVEGGTGDPTSATSADRHYRLGARYLVSALLSDGRLTDNACSGTREWSDELAALRPAEVRVPATDPGASPDGPAVPGLVGIAAVVLLAAVAALAFASGSRHR